MHIAAVTQLQMNSDRNAYQHNQENPTSQKQPKLKKTN